MIALTTTAQRILFAGPYAKLYSLDVPLVCAVTEQESGWNPFAVRAEPAFYARYILPLKLSDTTEAFLRAASFGVMQVMGQVARENGFAGRYLTELCDPDVGMNIGCKVLAAKLKQAGGNVGAALLLWNGGANKAYPDEVANRMATYTTPLGAGS
jgi:soluble lytic murein transglycosylase-like protein